MSMPRGLAKATAYYNNLEAWREWRELVNQVEQAGKGELVAKFSPPENAGWRKVDKAKSALRKAFQQGLHTDAAIVPPVEADSKSDIIPAGEVDTQPRR